MNKDTFIKFYVTTAIDYANDVIHVGHAYEKILADCVARYERLKRGDKNVYFTTGTDEHGTTNEKAALAKGLSPLEHVTEVSLKDKEQIDALNISYDRFIRTTDEDHRKTALEFFTRALKNGDIYKDTYKGYYCEGCEAHKTLSELDENHQCPNHQTRQIQELNEDNYFFRWSKYADFLKELIESDTLEVRPLGKKAEMLGFLKQELKDITVTRPKYKVGWGFTAPNDEEQVIYVWFDALINYLTQGSPQGFWDEDTEIVHFVGKDIARWHTLLWPAMLKSAGYRLPNKVYVHGFINLNGEKISKSRGNVIRPFDLVEKFGVDGVRYYFLKHGPIVEDVDISLDRLTEVYNADLANGLGNTVARIAKLAERSGFEFELQEESDLFNEAGDGVFEPITDGFRVDHALDNIWKILSDLDKHINDNEPWAIKDETKLKEVLSYEVNEIRKVAKLVEPFIPDSAKKIQEQFNSKVITSGAGLFPRM